MPDYRQHAHTQIGQRIPSQSGQHAHTQVAQCAPTQYAQPVPTQSAQPIPTRSRQIVQPHSEQGTGHGTGECFPGSPVQSGHNTHNQSQQPNAQSRQHTPEGVNVLSIATNENGRWNIGSENSNERMRVEVVDGILEASYYCSAKNREIMYEQLEPTGHN